MKAIVSGAGIAGLSNARFLAEAGWDVVVLERAPARRREGYMMDFFGPGFEAAEALDLVPRLRELSYSIDGVNYIDRRGKPRATLSYQQFSRMVDGKLLSIMRPDLELALLESLPASVELHYATTIETIDNRDDGVTVTLSDGSTQDADLLVSAEGIHSQLRGQVFGPEEKYLRYLGFHTAAFIFHDPVLNAEIGPQFALTDTTDRQAGIYGLRGGDVAVFTVHRTDEMSLPADPRGQLQRRYAQLSWFMPRALKQCPPQIYYDQVAQVIMPQWHTGRVILAGDAAHAVSLLAGQGASLAVAGAQVLARELAAAESIDAGLDNYEQTWRPQVEVHQEAGRRAASWFVPSNRLGLGIRRLGLRLMSVPGFDRYLSNRLVGKTGAKVKL